MRSLYAAHYTPAQQVYRALSWRFDLTRAHKREAGQGLEQTGAKYVCVYGSLCACACVCVKECEGGNSDGQIEFLYFLDCVNDFKQKCISPGGVEWENTQIKAPVFCIIHFISVYQQ